jgi:hypothetical protein
MMIHVSEDLPPEGKLVIGYSEVHHTYYICKWTAARGWLSQKDATVQIVTHWDNTQVDFSLQISDDPNKELAKKYGFDVAD